MIAERTGTMPADRQEAVARVRSRAEGVLAKLIADYPRYFPAAPAAPTIVDVTPMPRRLSDIARAELAVDGASLSVYVKLHKKSGAPLDRVRTKARLEFDTLADLHPKFRAVPRCDVVRPIAFFAEDLAVVTEVGEGENLHGLVKHGLRRGRREAVVTQLEQHCRESGVWLRHFQALTARPHQAPLPVAELLGKVSADLDACRAIGLPAAEADRLLALVRRHLAALDGRPFPVVGAHPDFQPDNLLVGSRGVTVLDFTSFCYAPPVSDVARFVAALMFLEKNPVYSPRTVTRLLSAFLDGYGQPAAALNPALTVYVVRFTVQAAATVRSWRLPGALRRLIERQVIRHTTSWCRDLLHRGEFSIDAAR